MLDASQIESLYDRYFKLATAGDVDGVVDRAAVLLGEALLVLPRSSDESVPGQRAATATT